MMFAVSVIAKMLKRTSVLLGSRQTKYPWQLLYKEWKVGTYYFRTYFKSTYVPKQVMHGYNLLTISVLVSEKILGEPGDMRPPPRRISVRKLALN